MPSISLNLSIALSVCAVYGQVVVSHDANQVSSGYVFYAPTASEQAHLLRNDGSIVHSWPGSGPAGLAVKLLPDGAILRTVAVFNSTFFNGRGAGGQVEKRSWDGELLWSYSLPNPDKYLQHHDAEALPNGNILIVAWELHTPEEALAAGRDPAKIPPGGLWSEAIFEVRPEPPSGGTIVWQWRVWDHLTRDGDPARIDIGFTGSTPDPSNNPDWLHINSVSYNEKLDRIMLSSRPWSEIWIIDHSTTAEEAATNRGGKYKRGGDLLYRWGNPRAYRAGTAADQRLFNQHDAHWIADDLPGAGHILVFNNGIGRGYSSADELVPPMDAGGNYTLETNGRYGPAGPVWTFGATAGPNFITQTAGGAQRLRNGNTILCLSNANRVVEATPEKKIVWDLNLGAGEAGGFTFRANRFAADSPQLAQTELGARAPAAPRNAASLEQGPLAPGALALANGAGFAKSAAVKVTDAEGVARAAAIIGTSAAGLTFQVPPQTVVGPARLTVDAQTRDFRVNSVSPGLFAADGDGDGVGAVIAVIDAPQGRTTQLAFQLDSITKTYVPKTIPFSGTVYLSLYGTGFTATATPPRVTIGGVAVPLLAVTALAEFPGVDQIDIGPLPASLAGKRNQPIIVSLDGAESNDVDVSFQ